jgi:hypothetical protein
VGVSYKTVVFAGESGDASPSTPIGVRNAIGFVQVMVQNQFSFKNVSIRILKQVERKVARIYK